MRIFIGEETGLAPLEGCSLVTAPYGRDGQVLGVLGVIGPTRMAYDRVIPMVQATADVLGAALTIRRTRPAPIARRRASRRLESPARRPHSRAGAARCTAERART